MDKIGIVTFHRSTSYGACLQTYATYKYFVNHGYETEVIDYTNLNEQKFRRWSYKENGKISGYITSLVKNVIFHKKLYADKAFGNPSEYYTLTNQRYETKSMLQELSYDCLVAGSDQIWSPSITQGIDDIYLLNFGKASKRISIASSLGSVVLNEEQHKVFSKAFKQFTAISVREPFAKEQLQKDTNIPIEIILDPTFLLTANDWEELIKKSKHYKEHDRYILTFFVAPQKDYRNRVQEYADKLGLPIWSIQPTKIRRVNSDKLFVGEKIEDFLALIKNAELIITDSFHGVALSVNLQKDFIAFKNIDNPVRVDTLLKKLNLLNRIDMKASNYLRIEYEEANKYLDEARLESVNWIQQALKENV